MSSIYDLFGSSAASSNDLYSTLFGGGSTGTANSLTSSLGDFNMIKSGAYKKTLKSYYATVEKNSDSKAESIKGSGTTDSKENLSSLKSAASKLNESAQKLKKTDYSKVEKAEDLLSDVKSLVDNYNNTLNATKKLNSYSILQTGVWATEAMNASEATLNKLGITIGEDNTLKLDEEKFKNADLSTVKSLFSGSGSLADRISSKASSIALQSANQIEINRGNGIYNSNGTIG